MGHARRVMENVPLEPTSTFASTLIASTAPTPASVTAIAFAATVRAPYEAPTTTASKTSASRATLSNVASGDADQTIEIAHQAKNVASAASAAQAWCGTRGRLPTAPST